jgi:SAM-dependent methyltransferase
LPIGLGQTISKPSVVARMLARLLEGRSKPSGRVMEIGTGCGYQAALLSHIAKEVYSIERLRGLHDKARENLRHLRLPNVHLILGDGMLGFPSGATYSAIIIAFLAGIHWACFLFFANTCPRPLLLTSNLVALLAWLGLLAPQAPWSMLLHILCFLYLLVLDHRLQQAGILPAWFYRLRCRATSIVVLSLGICMVVL